MEKNNLSKDQLPEDELLLYTGKTNNWMSRVDFINPSNL